MFDYTPLKAVLRLIPRGIREEESDTNLLGYALDAYRDLNLSQRYVNNVKIIPIVDHKVDLPKGLVLINSVTFTNNPAPEEEKTLLQCYNGVTTTTTTEDTSCNSCGVKISCGCPGIYFTDDVNAYCTSCGCGSCIAESESFTTTSNKICRPTLNYQLFLDTNFSKRFTIMKYVGGSNCPLSPDCPNRQVRSCNDTFSFSAANNQLITSADCGLVCLNYSEEVKDEEGNFMIPKESSLLRGLAFYAEAMSWRNRAGSKEEGTNSMFTQTLQMAENNLRRARGLLIASGIDHNLIREVGGMDNYNSRMSRIPFSVIGRKRY